MELARGSVTEPVKLVSSNAPFSSAGWDVGNTKVSVLWGFPRFTEGKQR